jgi:23S rRNA pseudouridine1911/1915/1917 synthase
MDNSRNVDLEITESLPLLRIDTYLSKEFPGISRAIIQRLIRQENVLVNQTVVKPNYRPHKGDKISIYFPEPVPAEPVPNNIPLDILFEDSDLVVVNKAAGMVVHPGAGHDNNTLVNALLHHCGTDLSGIGGVARPGIVHRLDKDTSGCIVMAKNDTAHAGLSSQFADRTTFKTYRLIACGVVPGKSGRIDVSIGRHPTHRKRMATEGKSDRQALTEYLIHSKSKHVTYLSSRIYTGRTHQIRVHFKHLGYPLVGDLVYGKRKNQVLKEMTNYSAPRQLLHSYKLGFTHPVSSERLYFQAALPQDFENALKLLFKDQQIEQE